MLHRVCRFAVLGLAVVGVGGVAGQDPPPSPIPSRWHTITGEPRDAAGAIALVTRLAAEHKLNAISVAVVQDGRLAFTAVAGEVAAGQPADARTVFRGASLSKPVFAYLVLRLVDAGVVALDAPIANVFPRPLVSYEHYTALAGDPRLQALTARRILSQQSGLPNWHRQGPVPFIADAGAQFGYSGEGYAMLQHAIEERTGRPINDLAREYVFAPLGMRNTSYRWEARFDGHWAVDLNSPLAPLLRLTRERANVAGSLITNAEDYARFLAAVLDGRGLSDSTRAVMFTPQVRITSRSLFSAPGTDTGAARSLALAWAVGWGHMTSPRGGAAIFHVGREEGCEAYAVAFPGHRTGVVALAMSPLTSTYSAPLVEGLIGDGAEPLEWLEYGATARTPRTRQRASMLGGALVLGVAVLAALTARTRTRSG
jgi:CubicO group peptidase (beta-lactamase class C family)